MTLLAGFLGAILGSLATIGTQATLAWLDRRNRSRAAALLLYGDLIEARDTIAVSVAEGGWKHRRHFDYALSAWQMYRGDIARAVGSRDFHQIAGALKAIEALHFIWERNCELGTTDEGFSVAYPRLHDAHVRCDKALPRLARAGSSFVERRVTRTALVPTSGIIKAPEPSEPAEGMTPSLKN